MASFGKLTDYFNRRKSREELRGGRSSRRSGSYCCTVAEARSLERTLQRPLLAKSRTLPSIPQSPAAARVHRTDLIGGSPPGRTIRSPINNQPNACTLPPAGELWRLEDDGEEGAGPGRGGGACPEPRPRSQSPFSQLRARAAYLRKSLSVDDHLGVAPEPGAARQPRAAKSRLKRKFSLGSADRKEAQQKKSESGISKLTHHLSLKERPSKTDKSAQDRPQTYRRRSLSLDWADSTKMSQPVRGNPHGGTGRKESSLSSPSAARRLYRNLSGKFRVGSAPTGLEDGPPAAARGGEKECPRRSNMELDWLQRLPDSVQLEELDLNTPNSEGLLPLDIAIMTNNAPMARLLLRSGAKESPHFMSLEGRTLHLSTLLQEADQRVSELRTQLGAEGEIEGSERERQLKAWGWRQRLFTRMQTGFQHASESSRPACRGVSSVTSSTSLRVDFQEPSSVNAAVVTKYKVGWSISPCMSPLLGETLVEDTTQLRCDNHQPQSSSEQRLANTGCLHAGPGPVKEPTVLLGHAPSRDRARRVWGALLPPTHPDRLGEAGGRWTARAARPQGMRSAGAAACPQMKDAPCSCHARHQVCPEPQEIPIVEVEDAYSSSLMQDFLWFTKVSYLWEDILWLQQCLSPSQTSCSCTLQTRVKILQAVSLLQGMLGVQDLGQAYFEPIKDKQGNALLVLLRDMSACPGLDGMHWTPLCKLQLQRKSVSCPDEPTALDTLLITLHEKLVYHRRSRKQLSPGLYLGYLKLCTSMDQIRALVPQKLPNVLCHTKIRDNANVSREEWQWLRALTSLEESLEMDEDSQSAPHRLLQELRSAAKDLLAHINMPGNQAQDFRIYTEEVVEFGVEVSFLLLLPPSDQVCTAPGQNNTFSPRSGFLTLPLQIFELVHFGAYCPGFIGQYCRVSALLELDSLMSQQALREAFSESELHAAKRKHQQVQEHVQHMEEIWREARWIMDALQFARYKQSTGGISLAWVIDFNNDMVPDKPISTSSQPDYPPSPVPSPEPCLKHSDFHGISDEEGSSEVFLTTDSDYDSSRAQSPRELDLLPASPLSSAPPEPRGYLRSDGSSSGGGGGGGGGGDALRTSTPDVLQGSESGQCGGGVGAGGCGVGGREGRRRCCGPEAVDSDFILPSRQIELLRITEKRQAYLDRCRGTNRSPRQPPARTLSEDSGTERLSALSPGGHRRGCTPHLCIYPQYPSGLPKDTSLRVTPVHLGAGDGSAGRPGDERGLASPAGRGQQWWQRGPRPGRWLFPGAAPALGLVLVVEGREKWLQDDFCPLELQNPWQRGKLCVRIKEYSPLALKHSQATTV
ncbi:unnamed protein product [Lota lota]